jgi:predicted transcriptional regulator
MMKILDQAIAKARTLPEERPRRADETDEETRTAIREGLAQAKRGEFVPEQDIRALWKRFGL